MTTDVVLTGTGIPTVSPERAGPGVLVRCGDASLQFDAGRATTMRLAAAGVACGDLTALFITHHHSDHMVGLPDVLMSRWILPHDRRDEPLTIIVPDGEGARIAGHMLDVWRNELQTRAEHVGRTLLPVTNVVAFAARAEPQVVWESDTIRVLSCLVHHEPLVPAVAYRIETPDGVVAISGDTRPCEEMERLAAGADVLVHEAMRSTLPKNLMMRPALRSSPRRNWENPWQGGPPIKQSSSPEPLTPWRLSALVISSMDSVRIS